MEAGIPHSSRTSNVRETRQEFRVSCSAKYRSECMWEHVYAAINISFTFRERNKTEPTATQLQDAPMHNWTDPALTHSASRIHFLLYFSFFSSFPFFFYFNVNMKGPRVL